MFKVVGHLQKTPLAQLPPPYRLDWDGRTGEDEADAWGCRGEPRWGGHHCRVVTAALLTMYSMLASGCLPFSLSLHC